jgi:hypothetical protein
MSVYKTREKLQILKLKNQMLRDKIKNKITKKNLK